MASNYGLALAGYGRALPQIQEMQKMREQKDTDAATARVLQQYARQQQMQGAAGGGAPGQGGFAGGMPPLDKMIDMLGQSGLPQEQQFAALKQYGAFASPFERMMNQMEMKQMQIDNQATLTRERLDMMRTIADINNNSRADIADKNRKSKENEGEKNRNNKLEIADDNRDAQGNKASDINVRAQLDGVIRQKTALFMSGIVRGPQVEALDAQEKELRGQLQKANDTRGSKSSAPRTAKPVNIISDKDAAAAQARVAVVDKDGNEFTVPAEQLAEAEAQGYKRK